MLGQPTSDSGGHALNASYMYAAVAQVHNTRVAYRTDGIYLDALMGSALYVQVAGVLPSSNLRWPLTSPEIACPLSGCLPENCSVGSTHQ